MRIKLPQTSDATCLYVPGKPLFSTVAKVEFPVSWVKYMGFICAGVYGAAVLKWLERCARAKIPRALKLCCVIVNIVYNSTDFIEEKKTHETTAVRFIGITFSHL